MFRFRSIIVISVILCGCKSPFLHVAAFRVKAPPQELEINATLDEYEAGNESFEDDGKTGAVEHGRILHKAVCLEGEVLQAGTMVEWNEEEQTKKSKSKVWRHVTVISTGWATSAGVGPRQLQVWVQDSKIRRTTHEVKFVRRGNVPFLPTNFSGGSPLDSIKLLLNYHRSVRSQYIDEEDASDGLYEVQEHSPFVWTRPLHSEYDFSRAVRLTFLSANHWALVTSYGCSPIAAATPFDASSTWAALWSSIFHRFSDDVDLIFAYNKDSRKQVPLRKTNVHIAQGKNSGWQEVIKRFILTAYQNTAWANEAISGEFEKKKNTSKWVYFPRKPLNARIYFVEMNPIGATGSWHTKFFINDQQIFATGGWSIGNRAKPMWMDAGVIMTDKGITEQEKRYFLKHMLEESGNKVRRLVYDPPAAHQHIVDGNLQYQRPSGPSHKEDEEFAHEVAFSFDFVKCKPLTELRERMSVDYPAIADSNFDAQAKHAGFPQGDSVNEPYSKVKVRAVQLRSRGSSVYWPQFAPGPAASSHYKLNPIMLGLVSLFARAQPGDTVWIRQHNFLYCQTQHLKDDIMWRWALKYLAPKAGVMIKVLVLDDSKSEAETQKAFKVMLKGFSKIRLATTPGLQRTSLQTQLQAREIAYGVTEPFGMEGRRIIRDHGKVYALEQSHEHGGKTVIAVGTLNANMQSYRGSNENEIFLEEESDGPLLNNFLKSLWNAGRAITVR